MLFSAGCSRSTGPAWTSGDRGTSPMEFLPHRGLTVGEKAMLWPVFRDGVDYDAVQIIHAAHPFQPSDAYMAPRGHIYAPGHLFFEDWSAPDVDAEPDDFLVTHSENLVGVPMRSATCFRWAVAGVARGAGDVSRLASRTTGTGGRGGGASPSDPLSLSLPCVRR